MSSIKFNPRTILLLAFISAVAAVRVAVNSAEDISALANFSPVGAMAVFGGAYFNKQWKAVAFPLLMLFISDVVLQQTVYAGSEYFLYGGWYWVYAAFVLMTLTGRWMLREITIKSFILSTLVSVFIHWIVTDFGVWYGSTIFEQNLKGYIDCLAVAIPYEWRFLSGTLVYGIILFGLFEWMQNRKWSPVNT